MDGTQREKMLKLPDAADERATHLCSKTDVIDSDLDDTFRAALLVWPAVSGSSSSSKSSVQRFSSELKGLAHDSRIAALDVANVGTQPRAGEVGAHGHPQQLG